MVVVVFLVAVVVLFGAYFLGRFAVSRASGVRGFWATLGLRDDAWQGVPLGRRVGASVAGFVGYYVGVAVLVAIGLAISGESTVDEASMRVTVAASGPAAQAGVRSGDRIVSVGGAPTPDWATLKAEVAKYPGTPVAVVVERNGAQESILVTPGESGVSRGKIMVGPPVVRNQVSFATAIGHGFVEPFRVLHAAGRGFVRTFSGAEHPELTGPVGIVRETSRAADNALGDAFRMAGLLAAYFFYIALIVSVLTVPRPRGVQ